MNQMTGIVLAFAMVAIVVGIGGTVLAGVQSTQTSGTIPYNATTSGLSGITTFGNWLPTIAVVLAAAVVIGIIVKSFA